MEESGSVRGNQVEFLEEDRLDLVDNLLLFGTVACRVELYPKRVDV